MIQSLVNSTYSMFLVGSLLTTIQFLSSAVVGGAIGIGLGVASRGMSKILDGIAAFLRIGMWIPVFLIWSIPTVSNPPSGFSGTFVAVISLSISAVVMASLRDYIVSSSLLKSERSDVIRSVCKTAVMQSLLVCLISQPTLLGFGWLWFYVRGSRAVAATTIVVIILFVVERVFRSSFDTESAKCARIAQLELIQVEGRHIVHIGAVILFVLFVWQLVSMTKLYSFVSSPLDVSASLFVLLIGQDVWKNFYVSTIEIFGGLIIAVTLGLLFWRVCQMSSALRDVLLGSLPMTYMTPIMALMVVPGWFAQFEIYPKVVGIGLVSMLPFFRLFWGLRAHSFGLRILMGVDKALPFAFVAMMFVESMASHEGLEFWLARATALGQDRSEAVAIVLLIVALFTIYSSALRSIAKYKYSAQLS